jgi:anaerobic glycerol-3-phosphate dehydrogenase
MAEQTENTYVNKDGEERDFSELAFKKLSPGEKAKWQLKETVERKNLETAVNIPSIKVNNEVSDATKELTEVFDELGIKYHGITSIHDLAITAAAALRGSYAKTDGKKEVKKEEVKETAKEPTGPKKFEDMTPDELKAELDKRGVPYKSNNSAATLLKLLQDAD